MNCLWPMEYQGDSMVARAWVVTVYGYDKKNPGAFDFPAARESVAYAIWQEEKCPDTGRHHLQMYVELVGTMRKNAVSHLFAYKTEEKEYAGARVAARRGSRDEARAYCMKEETQVSGPYEYGTWRGEKRTRAGQSRADALEEEERIIAVIFDAMMQATNIDEFKRSAVCRDNHKVWFAHKNRLMDRYHIEKAAEAHDLVTAVYKNVVWQPWQAAVIQEVDRLIAAEDPRTILWVWETEGAVGKTFLCKYFHLFRDGVLLGCGGKDMLHGYGGQRLIMLDFAKSDEDFAPGMVGAVEKLRNGYYFTGKYESRQVLVPHQPLVIVFANFSPPDTMRMSIDRVKVMDINNRRRAEYAFQPWHPSA